MENPVDRAVLAATSEQLQMPDQKLMKDVADLINTRSDMYTNTFNLQSQIGSTSHWKETDVTQECKSVGTHPRID